MPTSFVTPPASGRFLLTGATAPASLLADGLPAGASARDDLAGIELLVADGRVAAIGAPGTIAREAGLERIDLKGGMIWPGLVDMHTHIDKGHICPRAANPDGTFMGALSTVMADRETLWSAEDVGRRMEFSLAAAYAHGTVALRTHLDSRAPQHRISWPVFAALRDRWADKITLQGVSILGVDSMLDAPFLAELADLVAESGGILGCVTFMIPEVRAGIEATFRAAAERGLDLDFHVDETMDPGSVSLAMIAETKLAMGFAGTVTVGHCCSLGTQDEATALRTLDLVAKADLAVVSLPMCNMYLQDREPGRTPRRRGITLVKELAARGVRVSVASDNTRDPFYAYGDLDMLDVFGMAVRIGQLDHPVGAWPRAVTATPAQVMGLPGRGLLAVGGPADLVLCNGRDWTEVIARPQFDRIVLRGGRAIDTTPPDYRLLDDLVVKG
jgi:cytosine deaminase